MEVKPQIHKLQVISVLYCVLYRQLPDIYQINIKPSALSSGAGCIFL